MNSLNDENSNSKDINKPKNCGFSIEKLILQNQEHHEFIGNKFIEQITFKLEDDRDTKDILISNSKQYLQQKINERLKNKNKNNEAVVEEHNNSHQNNISMRNSNFSKLDISYSNDIKESRFTLRKESVNSRLILENNDLKTKNVDKYFENETSNIEVNKQDAKLFSSKNVSNIVKVESLKEKSYEQTINKIKKLDDFFREKEESFILDFQAKLDFTKAYLVYMKEFYNSLISTDLNQNQIMENNTNEKSSKHENKNKSSNKGDKLLTHLEENLEFLVNIDFDTSKMLISEIVSHEFTKNSYFSSLISDDDLKLTIHGFINDREFTVQRTLKEFHHYRKLLFYNFPGIYIPMFTNSYFTGYSNKAFIKTKLILIQNFLNQIGEIPFFVNTRETYLFFDSLNENFLDVSFNLYINDRFGFLLSKYNKLFPMIVTEDFNKILDITDLNSNISNYSDIRMNNVLNNEVFVKINNLDDSQTKVKEFYNYLVKYKEFLSVILEYSTNSQTDKIQTEKEIEMVYRFMFEYDNYFINECYNIADKEAFNRPVIESKLTLHIFNTNFETSYHALFEWSLNESLKCDAIIELIESILNFDRLVAEKLLLLNEKNEAINQIINPSFFYKMFIPINYGKIEELYGEIDDLKIDIIDGGKFIEVLYKILLNLIIPSYKMDKKKNYSNFLSYIKRLESNEVEKNSIVSELLYQHIDDLAKLMSTEI